MNRNKLNGDSDFSLNNVSYETDDFHQNFFNDPNDFLDQSSMEFTQGKSKLHDATINSNSLSPTRPNLLNSRTIRIETPTFIDSITTNTNNPTNSNPLIIKLQNELLNSKLKIMTLFEIIKQLQIDANIDDSLFKQLLVDINNISNIDELNSKLIAKDYQFIKLKEEFQNSLVEINEYLDNQQISSNMIDQLFNQILLEFSNFLNLSQIDDLNSSKDLNSDNLLIKIQVLNSILQTIFYHFKNNNNTNDHNSIEHMNNDALIHHHQNTNNNLDHAIAHSTDNDVSSSTTAVASNDSNQKKTLSNHGISSPIINDGMTNWKKLKDQVILNDEQSLIIIDLQNKLKKKDLRLIELQEQVMDLKSDLNEKDLQLNQLQEDILKLKSNGNDKDVKLIELKSQLNDKDSRFIEIQSNLKDKESKINDLKNNLNDKKLTINELKNNLNNKNKLFLDLEKISTETSQQLENYKIKLDDSIKESNNFKLVINDKDREIQSLNEKLNLNKETLNESISSFQSSLEKGTLKMRDLIAQNDRLKSNLDDNSINLKMRLQNTREERDRLSNQLKISNNYNQQLKLQLKNYNKNNFESELFKKHLLLHFNRCIKSFISVFEKSSIDHALKKLHQISLMDKISDSNGQHNLEKIYYYIEDALSLLIKTFTDAASPTTSQQQQQQQTFSSLSPTTEVNENYQELEKKYIFLSERRMLDEETYKAKIKSLERENEKLLESKYAFKLASS
ncbi:hypothetical protein TBLA_0A04410 [Henningerozyma blattae CBS 6284]|uniref:Mto2p-binding domain-containing protein n=1 Tax=Henningerozyma blattae (strain ATCC 34711 / CBS 6284 / DSM 70876 / NBRC 10599 / NRRL Y-10934 / UCD 77-7) TaxID=1071380 RepID=I2GVT4_HENB6|nr:hypothetical protein TBLA_0A04410 [Tetrapisispora blattae CBS 6284]CCH58236.1 hypothetical protein TBLA_0A04410 [Tetrapisispora blattae CBS 6284]